MSGELWDDYDPEDISGSDALYSGPHEIIEDLVLLTETCIDFEAWASDFRYGYGAVPGDESVEFSEFMSVKLARGEVTT